MTSTSVGFSPLDEIAALAPSEYEEAFLRMEFAPGLDYYLARLDRLMFSGGTLLDAGCGAGQWSLAASQRFQRVDALDVYVQRLDVLRTLARRMGVTNIAAVRGSLEALPYRSESADAVFCYGVIMFTDIRVSLAELYRVLKPGGRAYLCLNADGWSRHLIHERGVDGPTVRDAGRHTLYNTYWRRAIAAGLLPRLAQSVRRAPERMLAKLAGAPVGGARVARTVGRMCLLGSDAGRLLFEQVSAECGEGCVDILCTDAWRIATNPASLPTRTVAAEAFQPSEFGALAEKIGFVDFQWAPESGLACDWNVPAPASKYRARFGDDLAVWEALLTKPSKPMAASANPQRHIADARAAREQRLFVEPADTTVLSTGSRETYLTPLVDRARRLGERLGGNAYLQALANVLIAEARTDRERYGNIVSFVQRSLFRDPVSQPVNPDGSLPDALTILLTARGRCGHTAAVLVELFQQAGMRARVRQLPSHVIAEVFVDGQWVIADADAFKNGVVPEVSGRLLTLDDLEQNPYQLDRFPPTGWFMRSDSRFARGLAGHLVRGYVDALDPDRRGFVSGYYVPRAAGAPPPVPTITHFSSGGGRLTVEWTASAASSSRDVFYRVSVGSSSRGWSYDDPGEGDEILNRTPADVFSGETPDTRLEIHDDATHHRLWVSVTAINDRIECEPDTFFWPSDEVALSRGPT